MKLATLKRQIFALSFAIAALPNAVQAGPLPDVALWGNPTCAVDQGAIARKNALRKASLQSPTAAQPYQAIIQAHKQALSQCRDRTFPQTQAVWLRLYPNDAKQGVLEDVLDRIVNRGYNQVFVEVFYDGRILLPVSDNPTPWRSVTEEAVKAGEIKPDGDIWADAIRKGQERGLKVHGWSFTLNFGYGYSERRDRTDAHALNGKGENSIAQSKFDPKVMGNGRAFYEDAYENDHLFIDPYSAKAKADFASAIAALAKRQPDGMLFDYVRYPTTFGRDTLINNVKQLWIYGTASRKALLDSAAHAGVKQLMSLYLDAGKVTPDDITKVENAPNLMMNLERSSTTDPARSAKLAEQMLWQLAVNHAYKGVISFVSDATAPLRQSNLPVGTVFFPGGNQRSADGYDARMQPWDRFPADMQRHPMTYAICDDGKCVAAQVTQVLRQSQPQTLVCPILAGTWGQKFGGHPSFETQMQAIKAAAPQINCISHFVYAWMEPESDKLRKAGKATGD